MWRFDKWGPIVVALVRVTMMTKVALRQIEEEE